MSKSYLAFHDGLSLSAVRLSDQVLVTLGATYEETAVFSGFDERYLRTLRAAYGANSGLPIEDER